MSEPGSTGDAGTDPSKNGYKSGCANRDHCKATPLERINGAGGSGPSRSRQDPYVAKAAERARNKLRDRIFQLNGGRIN